MQQVHNIRSYQPFPAVIPVHSVSSLRVTHPSAMVSRCKHRFPIDLHVLSILSAFILSQDQTLHSIIYFYIFFSPFIHWRDLLLNLDLLFIYHTTFLLLFSLSLVSTLFLSTKYIISKKNFVVNTFFEIFLSFFWFFIFFNFYLTKIIT